MDRRSALQLLGLSGSALLLPGSLLNPFDAASGDLPRLDTGAVLARLKDEPAAAAFVRFERGIMRLYLNGREEFPFFAVSVGLSKTIKGYRKSGIRFFQPLIGLTDCWSAPGTYDFAKLDAYFAQLLDAVPDAVFLPRIHLYAPEWWRRAHEGEMVKFGLPIPDSAYRIKPFVVEGEFNWWQLVDGDLPSLQSQEWKADVSDLFRAYIRHIEDSPLKSRIMGYHVVGGMTAEWHYPAARFLPDYSEPMQQAAGPVPTVDKRIHAMKGLLRDPAKEASVIDFYRKFHTHNAETVLSFLRIVKEETNRRVLAGTFYCYAMENVQIQEAGHLVPEILLQSEDVDYIASPYTYQHSNVPGAPVSASDVVDDAGHYLGRARGVGGDGGFRTLAESLRRHRKLFISEIDPTTYLEKTVSTEGGSGHETVEGSLAILRRDIGNVLATGNGGWLFDFGHSPSFTAGRGWYDDEPMHREIGALMELGAKRSSIESGPVSEIACVYDMKSYFVSQHWKAEEPWESAGIRTCDTINHWFVNTQARTIHRIGAPADFLYRFDLDKEDVKRYRLFLMVNPFYLDASECAALRALFQDSGVTVIWYYAPGYVTPEKLDIERMRYLTGFSFSVNEKPGPMMIRTVSADNAQAGNHLPADFEFGVKKAHAPRFTVKPSGQVRVLGTWSGTKDAAFAERTYDGWRSIYVGTAPLPVELLRPLAAQAGVRFWSSEADVVRGTESMAMVVASKDGTRTIELPSSMEMQGKTGAASKRHTLTMKFGEVAVFQKQK
ncbi:MAG: hypothetical protein ACM3Q4_16565 [Acidobacteriota bacterium]